MPAKNKATPNRPLPVAFLVTGDALVLVAGIYLAFLIRYGGVLPGHYVLPFKLFTPLFVLLNGAAFAIFELYRSRVQRQRWELIFYSTLAANAVSYVLGIAASFFLRSVAFPRPVFVIGFFLTSVFSLSWRRVTCYWFKLRRTRQRLLVVGLRSEAEQLAVKARSGMSHLYGDVSVCCEDDVCARLNVEGSLIDLGSENGVGNLPGIEEHEAIVLCPSLPVQRKLQWIIAAMQRDIDVMIIPDPYDILISGAKFDQIDDSPVFRLTSITRLTQLPWSKRCMDILGSALMLLVLSPVMLLVVLGVKLTSRGPVLYAQKRVGASGREFSIFKFRTMVQDAERKSGPVLSGQNDPRVTWFGKLLRASRLDELPQLFNILRGDMSLVGPRPERQFFIDEFVREIPHYDLRMLITGGLTGLAQVHGKYSTSPEDKLRYDLLYARMYTPGLDMRILVRTLVTMLDRSRAT